MEVIEAIRSEFQRYKDLAERGLAQLADEDLWLAAGEGNSVATLLQHVGGNLRSRFTDFLTTDGEKPWRNREGEFTERSGSREELLARWDEGWRVLEGALEQLHDHDLQRPVVIRGASLTVIEALTRSLAHTSYHVGQVILLARRIRGSEWTFLSIPPVQGAATSS